MFICYLTGGIDAQGQSWCPDCDAAAPSITEHVLDKTEMVVLKGVVTERDAWVGVADHPFKVHPIIKAGGVPSLLLCEGA